jgi:ribosome-binding ATPase
VKAGIIGPRGAGKSTVFHALTGLAPQPSAAQTKSRARPGQIKVPDPRLDELERIYSSRKKVPVELVVIDFAPGPKEEKPGAVLDATLIPLMRELDAILLVIPRFTGGSSDLGATMEGLESELVFADLDQVERRLERLRKERSVDEMERAALQRALAHLENGMPLRTLQLTAQEEKLLSHFCFLSQKPALVAINCDPEQTLQSLDETVREQFAGHGLEALPIAAAFEAELWELPEQERDELLREAGLTAPARERLLAALYERLGLMTFYTAGEPEAHAWALRQGSTALDAAGKIHSDIARGFIRAEVIHYTDFVELRSEAKVKAAGKLHLEGKEYLMQDGDIIHIRFKV